MICGVLGATNRRRNFGSTPRWISKSIDKINLMLLPAQLQTEGTRELIAKAKQILLTIINKGDRPNMIQEDFLPRPIIDVLFLSREIINFANTSMNRFDILGIIYFPSPFCASLQKFLFCFKF